MNYSEQSKSRTEAQAVEAASAETGGSPGLAGRLERGLGRWVDRVRRRAGWVLAAVALVTAAAGWIAATQLGMHTDTTEMLSEKLEWRQNYIAYKKAFPNLLGNMVIVVEAENPDIAEDGAMALADRLRGETDIFRYVLYLSGEPFFRRNGMLYLDVDELQDLADRLADAQPLLSTLAEDMSLRGLFGILAEASEEVVEGDTEPGPLVRVFEAIATGVEAVVEGRPYTVSWTELMRGEDGHIDRRQIILAKPRLDYGSFSPARAAVRTVRQAAADLGLDEARGVRVRLTGSAVIRQEELRSVSRGATIAGIISLVLVAGLLVVGLRSGRLVAATLITLIAGLVWTAAFAALAIGYLNLISVTFAVLFFGLAVDFGIQFCLRYREELGLGAGNAEALRRAASRVGLAITLAAVTSAFGFLAFVPTDYVGLAELGIIAGVGMFIALFLNVTLLPAMLTVLPARAAKGGIALPLGRLPEVVGRRGRAILWFGAALSLVGLAIAPFAEFEFDPIKLKDPTTESVQTFLDLTRESDSSPYTVGYVRPDLDAAEALARRLEELPLVDKAITLRSFVPGNQEEKLAIIEGIALIMTPIFEFVEPMDPPTMAERREAVRKLRANVAPLATSPAAGDLAPVAGRLAAALDRFAEGPGRTDEGLMRLEKTLIETLPNRLESLRVSLEAGPVTVDDLPQALRERMMSADGRALVQVYPKEDMTDQRALRAFVEAVRSVAPDATDSPVVMLEAGDVVIGAFRQAGMLALGLIVLLLLATLRSVVDTALVLLPLALAGLLTVAATVVFDVPFNLANVIALPLLLALGVDFGIHLVLRFRETPSVGALLRSSTSRAVLFSALTTMCSFGSLAVSTHRGIASMGYLLTIALTLALVCTLLVLPALLSRLGRREPAAAE